MSNSINVPAIRQAAKALTQDGGPITYLQNAQAMLDDAHLGPLAFTLFGINVASAHNDALDAHDTNIKGGIQHLRDAAAALNKTADNWEASDQTWVVKAEL